MLTHLPGGIFSIVALVLFLIKSIKTGDVYRIIGFSVFGFSLNLLYWVSTIYHWLPESRAKMVCRYGDHISIYFLIAGTYTPMTMVSLREKSGWIYLGIVWGILFLGTFLKIIRFDGFVKTSLLLYIGMGWVIIFALKDLVASIPARATYWLVTGGLFYTLGVFFFANDEKIPFYHAVWHLYVLAGSFCHFCCVYWYV